MHTSRGAPAGRMSARGRVQKGVGWRHGVSKPAVEDLHVAQQPYRYVEVRSRSKYAVVPKPPGQQLSPKQRFETLFKDCGRKAVMTRPYKPLGTPDHGLRRLPDALRPGVRRSEPAPTERVDSAPTLEAMHAGKLGMSRGIRLAGTGSGADDAASKQAKRDFVTKFVRRKPASTATSVANLRRFRRTGSSKSTGYLSLKDKIDESKMRMKSAKAGYSIDRDTLEEKSEMPTRADLERQWEREAEVANLYRANEVYMQHMPEDAGGPAAEGMEMLRRNLGRNYLPYNTRRPKTPYLTAPTITQASVDAESKSAIQARKERAKANFNKLVEHFGGSEADKTVAQLSEGPLRDPGLVIERRCADYHAAQKLLVRGLDDMLCHLELERPVMLERKKQALEYAVNNNLSNARRVMPAIRFAAELERSREQLETAVQAQWYGQLLAGVIKRTKKRMLEQEGFENGNPAKSHSTAVHPLDLANAIVPGARFVVDHIRNMTQMGVVMDVMGFKAMMSELRAFEMQNPIVVYAVIFVAKALRMKDLDCQRAMASCGLPPISFRQAAEMDGQVEATAATGVKKKGSQSPSRRRQGRT